MSQFRTMALGLAALLTVVLVACADSALPLSPSEGASFGRGGHRGDQEVQALRRHGGGGSVTDQVLITPGEGGTVSVGGVTLTVDPGAVEEPVVVKLTVPNGRFLYAQFAPHGLEFKAPATLSFDLGGTDADGSSDVLGLYVSEGPGAGAGRFTALETFGATVSGGVASFDIKHFSGYIVASGYQRSRF